MLQRLHRSIRCPLNGPQACSQSPCRLVMGAVDNSFLPIQLPQQRRYCPHTVKSIDVSHGTMSRNILQQGSSKINIDGLQSPADSQYRPPQNSKLLHQQIFLLIPDRVQIP